MSPLPQSSYLVIIAEFFLRVTPRHGSLLNKILTKRSKSIYQPDMVRKQLH